MLEFANRIKSGRDNMAPDNALTRLRGSTIKTNIRTGHIYQTSDFGMIERDDLIRKYGFDGRLRHIETTLSEWLWNAIMALKFTTLIGRRLSRRAIAQTQVAVQLLPKNSRRMLTRTTCEHLDWHLPGGGCRAQLALPMLEKLEALGILELPARRKRVGTGRSACPTWFRSQETASGGSSALPGLSPSRPLSGGTSPRTPRLKSRSSKPAERRVWTDVAPSLRKDPGESAMPAKLVCNRPSRP